MDQEGRPGSSQNRLKEGSVPHVLRQSPEPPGRGSRATTLLGQVSFRAAFLPELKLFPPRQLLGRRVGGAGSNEANTRPCPGSRVFERLPRSRS